MFIFSFRIGILILEALFKLSLWILVKFIEYSQHRVLQIMSEIFAINGANARINCEIFRKITSLFLDTFSVDTL